ncbi:hypothetical protein KBX29_08700 [Corynebacterium sp. CCUG 18816]|uniref:hypothetical protein n=1 Tax=Corynebacterium pseudogenitalium TaxID=38303 RepID=UPI00210C8881|nr:hypothetical protein [Corynebacterium pseudogenitalium]MCQ4616902.1 hypothetical protein [Corynebacterium pseudogenitalium]
MSSKTVKVYRVQIEPPVQPFLSVKRTAQRVENALSQGSSAVRYGRIWRVGKVEHDGNVLIGKLGFVNRPKTSEVWNEDKLDFQEFEFEGGASSTFAVNLDTLKLAIQPTTNVPVTSALGAIRSLLSLEGEKWTISPLKRSTDFETWRTTVDKIIRAKYKLRKPNPHYGEAKSLEEIMENAEAEVVVLEMSSRGGLDLDSQFLRQTQMHTDRGYGEADFTGTRRSANGTNVETRFSSMAGAEEEAIEINANNDGEISNTAIADVSRRID